ncbi:thioredoxin family protein [Draconibacterium sp. IB214405]|uniref:thioredoxin family protein n=1 Tax=Draconibacterium sp. IB214405 TaxID=3097352 RepID=UPI002A0DFE48|nr:thioredoxin family protein [Draconibacterium sp. IB214405]MDX8338490.1 thioredoxin family protein [Draconibacterium sp. IB214405]
MFKEIKSLDEFLTLKEEQAAMLAYFSTDACNVCKVLKPKVEELVTAQFPKMQLVYVKSDVLPEVAAQNSVFAAPTIVVFFDGRETIRKSRAFGVDELQNEIARYYSMLFE